MEDELGAIFGRRVDLVNRRVLLQHENGIRRHEILSTAKAIVTMKANAA
jgi:predicted nucleotidyltransferase